MDRLLTRVYLKGVKPYWPENIWERRTMDGNPFWGIGSFCGLPVDSVIQYGRELTELEWDGNELFFSDEDEEALEHEVAAAYLALKEQMETEFPDQEFDLVVSVDEENHTGTIRFYGIRDGYHFMEPSREFVRRFENEAILIETVNEAHLETYLPFLEERLKPFDVRMESVGKNELRIQDTCSECSLELCWDEEFTLYFGSFHSHYGEEDWEELLEDIVKILSGTLVSVRIDCEGRWMLSSLMKPDEIPLQSRLRFLRYFFGRQKDFYKRVKEKGGILSITAWGEEKDREYRIAENGIERVEQEGREG